MADGYTTRLKAIKPESGGSLNTWGTKLNDNNFDVYDAAIAGSSALTITGDTTLVLTNGDDTSTQLPILHRYGGAPAAAFSVTYEAKEFLKLIHNASGRTATPKVSSGFSMPNGAISLVAYNSTYGDLTNVTPNYVGTGYTVSSNGHIANKLYVDNAIATASTPATAGTLLVSGGDTTAGYLSAKISASSANHSWAISGAGGDEDFQSTIRTMAFIDGGTISGAQAVVVGTEYLCDFTSTSYTITLPAAPSAGDRILLTKYGTNTMTLGLNSLKFNGSTSNPVTANEGQTLLRYTGASRGWVEL